VSLILYRHSSFYYYYSLITFHILAVQFERSASQFSADRSPQYLESRTPLFCVAPASPSAALHGDGVERSRWRRRRHLCDEWLIVAAAVAPTDWHNGRLAGAFMMQDCRTFPTKNRQLRVKFRSAQCCKATATYPRSSPQRAPVCIYNNSYMNGTEWLT